MTLAELFLDAAVAREGAAGGIALDEAKLSAAVEAYERALQQGDPKAATEEILTVAFFLDAKKGARDAARQIVEVARRATSILSRAGVAFDDLAAETERKSAALLGQSSSKIPVGQTAGPGAKWWQVR